MGGVMAALSPLRIPLQAMVVALAGAGMAWLCLNDHWVAGVVATGAIILIGIVCDRAARASITRWPLLAVYLFQGWLLIPLAVAVLASAAIIVLAIKTTLPKENAAGEPTSSETEKLVAAVAGGITTFLTATFVSWTGDAEDSKLSAHIQERFEARFTKVDNATAGDWVIAKGSRAENWVFGGAVGGIEGWGWKARFKRAREVKLGLDRGEITKKT
jgi:hypothetical protein